MSLRLMVLGTAPSTATAQITLQATAHLCATPQSFLQSDSLDGTNLTDALTDPASAMAAVTRNLLAMDQDIVLIQGLEACPAPSFDVTGWNLDVAANVGAKIVAVIDATGMGQDLARVEITTFLRRAASHHATVGGIVLVGARGAELGSHPVSIVQAPLTAPALNLFLDGENPQITTPLMFQGDLLARARADRRAIVMPEPEDERVLRATEQLLAEQVADIILIGDEKKINTDAKRLGLNLEGARIISPHDPGLVEKYAAQFAKVRASKGVSLEQAREKVQDVTYFATMMVHMGDADGMVSGATHTTAETIRPAFQVIKTAAGTSLVSSSFLMLMADHVLVMGDCAVNLNPTPQQLAEIALSSAQTAKQFGLEPAVAMLSYSTGLSGAGADVAAVAQATQIVKDLAPHLAVEGPIQYDAAVDPEVGASKAPGSAVAGHANVLIFPTLNAGNIAYKAVQRSAGAVAVGPIMQGLRRPVNDLSRGALVEDIVNTVAITAIQAQTEGNR